VQEYMLAIIRELIDRYEFDGLQLDWMRFPRHLSGSPDDVWGKRGILTDFTARVRQLLLARNPRAVLAARIPTSLAGCRRLGLDVAEWARREIVGFLVMHPFLTTDFSMPVGEVRDALDGAPIPVYAGLDFGHDGQSHCPESLRAAASGLYDSGADGVYVFNFPCWIERLAARPYHWLTGLDSPDTASQKPLLFSVSHRTHRVPHVDLPWQLPVTIAPGKYADVFLHLPRAAFPVSRVQALMHASGDVALGVNRLRAEELDALRRSELFVESVDPASRMRPEDGHVFRVLPATVRPGRNVLMIQNPGSAPMEVHRVNLGLW